jgi:hypothetical protein
MNNKYHYRTKWDDRNIVLEHMKALLRAGFYDEESPNSPKQACPDESTKAADPKDAPAPDTLPK